MHVNTVTLQVYGQTQHYEKKHKRITRKHNVIETTLQTNSIAPHHYLK